MSDLTHSTTGVIVGALLVALPCVAILRGRGSPFAKARRLFRLALLIAVLAGVMYVATATGLVHP